MSNIIEAIDYIQDKKITIIAFDFNQETMQVDVLLSNSTYLNKELNHDYSSSELTDLKAKFSHDVVVDATQKEIINIANDIKKDTSDKINSFITNVVNIKYDINQSEEAELAREINEMQDDNLKNKIFENMKKEQLRVEKFTNIIRESYICQLTGIFGQQFYHQFLGNRKSDINDRDEFNNLLDMFNKIGAKKAMFCDLNGFKLVNDNCGHKDRIVDNH